MIEVDLDPGRDSSLIEGPNSPKEDLRLDAATRSSDLAARPNQHLISDHAKIQRLDHLGLEGVGLHPSANPRRTFDWGLTAGRDDLDVRMERLRESIEVTPVVDLIKGANRLDVLLRHR